MKRLALMMIAVFALSFAAVPAFAHCGKCDEDDSGTRTGPAIKCLEKEDCPRKGAAKKACKADPAGASCKGEKTADAEMAKCPACGPMMALFQEGDWARSKVIDLEDGVALVFVSTDPAKVKTLQETSAAVGDRLREAAETGITDGFCPKCREFAALAADSAVRTRAQTIPTGTLVIVTSEDPEKAARIRDWASGMHKNKKG